MDKYKKLGGMLSALNAQGKSLPLFNASVVSIEGESCTIDIDGLHVDEIRLKATINGEANKVIITPAVGSMVLVGSLTGDLKDLAIIAVDEVSKLEYVQNYLSVLIDSSDGKVQIKNNEVGFYDLFNSLTSLFKQFKVYTPSGASGTALPDVVLLINQFETDFKKLLK